MASDGTIDVTRSIGTRGLFLTLTRRSRERLAHRPKRLQQLLDAAQPHGIHV